LQLFLALRIGVTVLEQLGVYQSWQQQAQQHEILE